MTDFTFYTPETASSEAKPILENVQKAYGFIPNLFAYMAEAPTTLEAYLALNALVEKTSLTPAQQQLALLTVSTENQCGFCAVAHRAFAKAKGADPQSIEAVHTETKVENESDRALVALALSIVRNRGWLPDEDIESFISAGFTKQQIMEVILIVSIKTLSNYINHLSKPEPNKELLAML